MKQIHIALTKIKGKAIDDLDMRTNDVIPNQKQSLNFIFSFPINGVSSITNPILLTIEDP